VKSFGEKAFRRKELLKEKLRRAVFWETRIRTGIRTRTKRNLSMRSLRYYD
jgi:hypothetical protein